MSASLIEPLTLRDMAGYHLTKLDHGAESIATVGAPNLRLMFDSYHVQIMGSDLTTRFTRHRELIGHIQIAAVPDRGELGAIGFWALGPSPRRRASARRRVKPESNAATRKGRPGGRPFEFQFGCRGAQPTISARSFPSSCTMDQVNP